MAVMTACVLAASAATVAPSLDGGFLNWDDDRFVTENPHVRGLDGANLAWAFGGARFEAYQPLHMVSYMVDGSLWPEWAPGYRLHNLLLYLLAVALLLSLLVRLGIEPVPAALGTLLFSLAPFHAESVAWISGRKDVLSLTLALLSWHAHLSGGRGGRARRSSLAALSAALMTAAMLAKSASAVVVPMIWAARVLLGGSRPGRSALALLPHILPAMALAVVVPWLWSAGEMIREPPHPGIGSRLLLVGWTAWHYLTTMAWPFRLSALYAEPAFGAMVAGAVGAALAVVLIAAVFAVLPRPRLSAAAGPLTALAWFAIGIAPFLNAVPLYYLVADRYLLFPSLGLALAGALVARRILLIRRVGRRMFAGAGMLILALSWGMARVEQCRIHRDSRSLWEHAVERQPEAFFARLKLAETLRVEGDHPQAAGQYREARRIRPGSRLALMGLLWAELLVDDPHLPENEAHDLMMQLAAAADEISLFRLDARLRQRGLDRASWLVREYLGEQRRKARSGDEDLISD